MLELQVTTEPRRVQELQVTIEPRKVMGSLLFVVTVDTITVDDVAAFCNPFIIQVIDFCLVVPHGDIVTSTRVITSWCLSGVGGMMVRSFTYPFTLCSLCLL